MAKALALFILTLAFWSSAWAQRVATLEFAPNVPVGFQKYLSETLNELFSFKGGQSTVLHRQIFKGPVDGEIYKKWFFDRVRKIALFENDCGLTAKIDSSGEPGVILISACSDLTPLAEKKIHWLTILFHEARHWEPAAHHWQHQICLDEMTSLPVACDSSPLSPYAVEKVLLDNLGRFCTNCPVNIQRQALEAYENPVLWRRLTPAAEDVLRKDKLSKSEGAGPSF